MSAADISPEAVEQVAKRLKRDIDWRPGSLCEQAAATLRALSARVAELERALEAETENRIAAQRVGCQAEDDRDAARAEVARLRKLAHPTNQQELAAAFAHLNGYVQSLVLGDPRKSVTVSAAPAAKEPYP